MSCEYVCPTTISASGFERKKVAEHRIHTVCSPRAGDLPYVYLRRLSALETNAILVFESVQNLSLFDSLYSRYRLSCSSKLSCHSHAIHVNALCPRVAHRSVHVHTRAASEADLKGTLCFRRSGSGQVKEAERLISGRSGSALCSVTSL